MKLRMRRSSCRPLTHFLLCAAALAAWPAQAAANHTVVATDFRLTASSHVAGASPDASSWTTLTYPGVPNTDDIKHTIGHFAPGMVANPEIVPKCPRDVYLADNCPADTLIGSSEADIHVLPPVGPVLTEHGRIYNVVQQGTEAGRLGIIVDAASKAFLEAAFYVRNKGDYGLDGDLDNLPRTLFGVGDIQIRRLKFTLFGTVQGRRYTRGPTSCSLKVSTGEGEAYDHPGFVTGPSDSYTPTDCDKLPFAPTFAMSVGDKGSTGERQKPPLNVTVTQKAWEAGILGNGVTAAVRDRPEPARLHDDLHARAERGRRLPAGREDGHRDRGLVVRGQTSDGQRVRGGAGGRAIPAGAGRGPARPRQRADQDRDADHQRQVHPLDGHERARPADEQLLDVADRRRQGTARVEVRPVLQAREQVPDDEPGGHFQFPQWQEHRFEAAPRRRGLPTGSHRLPAERRRPHGRR